MRKNLEDWLTLVRSSSHLLSQGPHLLFQQAAVRFRDQALCRQVKQRRSLLFSSWGYSPGQCRKLVAAVLEDFERLAREP